MINRRKFVQYSLASLLLPSNLLKAGEKSEGNPFRVPPLETGKINGNEVHFDLSIQSGMSRILASRDTETFGINQPFLGVTLKARKGNKIKAKVTNNLNIATTLHWHGMKLPAKADGGPHQLIAPGKTWSSEYDIIQPAATTWYHAHTHGKTGEHVYRGIAGMFILEDDESDALKLPSEYGVDDFPVIIQDREFNSDGSFDYDPSMHENMMGKTGNVILVNGVIKPVLKTKKSLLRLRILNGSNARIYNLAFSDGRDFSIIASDGGLLEHSLKSNSLILAPAERAEILVDVSDGGMPILRNVSGVDARSGNSGGGGMMRGNGGGGMMRGNGGGGMMNGNGQSFDIFRIDATGAKAPAPKIPKSLVKHSDQGRAVKERPFKLQMTMGPMLLLPGVNPFEINDKAMDMNTINETVKAGTTEIWVIKNTSSMTHPFHIHNAQFKIIEKTGGIRGHETGFKDTVSVLPGETVKVKIDFPLYRDKKIPYMYHCHILEHEDQGMMGQFVTV